MIIPLPAILISITSIIEVADQVPKFDLRSICEGNEGCLRGETAARNQLAEQWSQFPPAERAGTPPHGQLAARPDHDLLDLKGNACLRLEIAPLLVEQPPAVVLVMALVEAIFASCISRFRYSDLADEGSGLRPAFL